MIDLATTLRTVAAEQIERRERRAQRAASGLVTHSTSDTPLIEIDRDAARLSRMRRRLVCAAQTHQRAGQLRPAMITCTYRGLDDWRPHHLSETIKRVRHWLHRRGYRFRYCWVAELQERGAVHYHVLCWLPQGEDKPPFWDAMGWWSHGSTNSEWAHNAVGYIVKYVSKLDSKARLPAGARMHGSGGFDKDERKHLSWHSRPKWLRQLSGALHSLKRKQGGGWVQTFACGLRRALISPFIVVRIAGGSTVIARRDQSPALLREEFGKWFEARANSANPCSTSSTWTTAIASA